MKKADIGLIGLAVMGENLVLNMANNGYNVVVFNRTIEKVDRFIKGRATGKSIIGVHSIEELVNTLQSPRKIMLMIKAGPAIDALIEQLIPLLQPGDIIIDGGNSNFQDTIRRTKTIEASGLNYIGTGISGGEEGALNGPSIMPGGSKDAWNAVKNIFQSIAAKVDNDSPCCEWVGENGAGHFVKMVHNGIEYGDMQLICEVYQIMKELLGMNCEEMQEIFQEWNKGDLNSYLIEITSAILAYKDDDGSPLVEKILDKAGQKGTGKWTAISSLEQGVPLTIISEAVYARSLTSIKSERLKASKILQGPKVCFKGNKAEFLKDLQSALLASKIASYAQGYALMKSAAKEYNWTLNYGEIALMWRGGCIIRSAFLGKIKESFDKMPELSNLMLAPYFSDKLIKTQQAWRNVVARATENGIWIPAMAAALNYYDGYRSAHLPANLLQAQRDYFGAHTYERLDQAEGEFFHTNWTGKGGKTSSSTYNA
jgi:6-phosphogluconate dehydrogenase